ncbi:hypothetical protein AGOR_G00185960 [Albula goreensis]|uniref:C1q domain-containing protein n=1 Tax=Albula goreensis TaxID=1534307 RepID=A0A8T3D119_9TELE|nr:hypothetical protein AGOR_G00185960 [Albula goreensis]
MNQCKMDTNDKFPSDRGYENVQTTSETENVYARLYMNSNMHGPVQRNNSGQSSAGKDFWHKKTVLLCTGVWIFTMATLITGLVLYYEHRLHQIAGGTYKVSFTASLGKNEENFSVGPYSDSRTLVYKNVVTNFGDAYRSNTGIFTAPLRGVYFFSFTAFGWDDSYSAGVILYRNHEIMISAYEGTPTFGGGGANMITLQLDEGDIVYIKLRQNMKVHENGNLYNSFSGYLLFAI